MFTFTQKDQLTRPWRETSQANNGQFIAQYGKFQLVTFRKPVICCCYCFFILQDVLQSKMNMLIAYYSKRSANDLPLGHPCPFLIRIIKFIQRISHHQIHIISVCVHNICVMSDLYCFKSSHANFNASNADAGRCSQREDANNMTSCL